MLVVSCMDLRMIPLVTNSLKQMGYEGQYDLVSVAGGALSVGLENRQHLSAECRCQLTTWKETICSHVELSRKLHQSGEVWFIDHEDCGAYAAYYGASNLKEHEQHKSVLERVPSMLPNVKVRLFWMKLDGTLFELTHGKNKWVVSHPTPEIGTFWMHSETRRVAKIIYCSEEQIHHVYQDDGEISKEPVDTFISEWHDLNRIVDKHESGMG